MSKDQAPPGYRFRRMVVVLRNIQGKFKYLFISASNGINKDGAIQWVTPSEDGRMEIAWKEGSIAFRDRKNVDLRVFVKPGTPEADRNEALIQAAMRHEGFAEAYRKETTTFHAIDLAFADWLSLMTHRHLERDAQGNVVMGSDGKPVLHPPLTHDAARVAVYREYEREISMGLINEPTLRKRFSVYLKRRDKSPGQGKGRRRTRPQD